MHAVTCVISPPAWPEVLTIAGLTVPCHQELRTFLEVSGDLGTSYQWQAFQPSTASVLEGTAKFSMQLIGRESKVRTHVH